MFIQVIDDSGDVRLINLKHVARVGESKHAGKIGLFVTGNDGWPIVVNATLEDFWRAYTMTYQTPDMAHPISIGEPDGTPAE